MGGLLLWKPSATSHRIDDRRNQRAGDRPLSGESLWLSKGAVLKETTNLPGINAENVGNFAGREDSAQS